MRLKKIEEKQYHFLSLQCPDCKAKTTVLDFLFTSEGDIQIKLLCVPCGSYLFYDTSWEKLIVKAALSDNKKLVFCEGTFTKTLQ